MSVQPLHSSSNASDPHGSGGSLSGYLIGLAFLVLAVILWFGSLDLETPAAPTPAFDRSALDSGPRRTMMLDPPTTSIAGFDQQCSACHNLFKSNWDGSRPLAQHTEIILQHGLNDKCSNCHSVDNRDKLATYDGRELPFTEVVSLCASCHGPIVRDWNRGTHGKTLGSWQRTSPDFQRLACTSCHDPHHPAYEPMKPLPGPHTLRMTEPSPDHGSHDEPSNNPLRRYWDIPADHNHDHTGNGGDEG